MTAEQLLKVSVIEPISPAIERVKIMLFKPFDLGKWFIIGFCAWLAYLGTGGGPGGGGPRWQTQHRDAQQGLEQAKEFIVENLFWIIPVICIGIIVLVLLWLVVTWLSSRGHFMFLHCVAENKAEVKKPWTKYRQHANSLFLFRIVLGLLFLAVIALPAVITVLFMITMIKGGSKVAPVAGLLFGVLAFVLLGIVFALIRKFTMDFVVPIMFLRTTSCAAAWREFLSLLSTNKARLALYILFQVVIAIAIGAIVIAAIFLTCCCAACIFAIPYIGTVAMLPLLIFTRAYSLFYLRQFGLEYDVFGPTVTPA